MRTGLRWAAILVPTAVVVVVFALSDTVLDQALPFPVDTLFVGLVVLMAGLVMSSIAFRLVVRLEHQLRERNAELEQRKIRDGEIVPACAQVCPAGAITLGDMNDPRSRLMRLKRSPLTYSMLGELNTQPRTSYLAKLRNVNAGLVISNQ